MDYEKKSKDAISTIKQALRQLATNGVPVGNMIEAIKDIEEKYAESEDERIRKELITHCRNTRCVTEEGAGRIAKWIAYLEKQGQKETTWNKEDEENMNNVLYIFNQLKDTSFYKEDDIAEKTINWLKFLKNRLCSNNEYDKDMLGAIEYCIKNNRPLEKEHISWLEKQGGQNYKIIKGKNYFCVKTHNYAGVEWIKGTKYYASDNYTLVNQGCECYCPEYSKEEHNNLFEEVKYADLKRLRKE